MASRAILASAALVAAVSVGVCVRRSSCAFVVCVSLSLSPFPRPSRVPSVLVSFSFAAARMAKMDGQHYPQAEEGITGSRYRGSLGSTVTSGTHISFAAARRVAFPSCFCTSGAACVGILHWYVGAASACQCARHRDGSPREHVCRE